MPNIYFFLYKVKKKEKLAERINRQKNKPYLSFAGETIMESNSIAQIIYVPWEQVK